MPVKLRIVSTSGSVAPWEVALTGAASSIGRDAGCAVVLPDPNRHLSRRHATVENQGGTLSLLVNSKVNPVFVSGKEFGLQQRAPLRDGDVIVMADYRLTVVVEAAVARSTSGTLPHDDPFSWLNSLSPGSSPIASDVDPLAELSMPKAPAYDAPDPFLLSENRDKRLVQGMGTSSLPSPGQPPGMGMSLDPLSLVSGPANGPKGVPARQSGSVSPSLDDWLGGLGGAAPSSSGGDPLVSLTKPKPRGSTNADHVHDFDLPFTPPASRPVVAPRSTLDDPFADLLGPLPSSAPASAPQAPAVVTPAPAPAAMASGRDGDDNFGYRPTSATLPLSPRSAASADDILKPFFKGLGLDAASIPPEQAARYMEVAGQISRAAIGGIVQLLVARGEMKKELRADDRTQLAAANNNPLKMMESESEAIRFLFDTKHSNAGAFMPPIEAISDACQDIMAHEFGLVAGLRAAVLGALKRCDPQLLEQQAEKQGKLGGLLGNRKAQLWDGFVDWYKKTEETAADDIDRLFERDFLRAYTTQVKQMRGKK